jgi:hypothetical protein
MGDRSQLDRIVELEGRVRALEATLNERLASVVLVEKRKPGPVHKNGKPIKTYVKRRLVAKRGFVVPHGLTVDDPLPDWVRIVEVKTQKVHRIGKGAKVA